MDNGQNHQLSFDILVHFFLYLYFVTFCTSYYSYTSSLYTYKIKTIFYKCSKYTLYNWTKRLQDFLGLVFLPWPSVGNAMDWPTLEFSIFSRHFFIFSSHDSFWVSVSRCRINWQFKFSAVVKAKPSDTNSFSIKKKKLIKTWFLILINFLFLFFYENNQMFFIHKINKPLINDNFVEKGQHMNNRTKVKAI